MFNTTIIDKDLSCDDNENICDDNNDDCEIDDDDYEDSIDDDDYYEDDSDDYDEVIASDEVIEKPPDKKLSDEVKLKLLNLENEIKKRIIGQDAAIFSVCRAIIRNKVGFKDPVRPVGSFFFLGTSGVGKTELCRALADAFFGSESKLIKIDMSEFRERHEAVRLIGSVPGYIGYGDGGQLTNKVKENPESVVLFDEIEKAHPDVFNIFLQIMEDGILTSGQGEAVSFKDTIVIMTSNIGAEDIAEKKKAIGFANNFEEEVDIKNKVMEAFRKSFKQEFINRIDEIIVFDRLNEKRILQICEIMLDKVKENALKLNINVEFSKNTVRELVKQGFDKEYGARPLRRVIAAKIEDMLADKLLTGELSEGDDICVVFGNKCFAIKQKTHNKSIQTEELYNNNNEN